MVQITNTGKKPSKLTHGENRSEINQGYNWSQIHRK